MHNFLSPQKYNIDLKKTQILSKEAQISSNPSPPTKLHKERSRDEVEKNQLPSSINDSRSFQSSVQGQPVVKSTGNQRPPSCKVQSSSKFNEFLAPCQQPIEHFPNPLLTNRSLIGPSFDSNFFDQLRQSIVSETTTAVREIVQPINEQMHMLKEGLIQIQRVSKELQQQMIQLRRDVNMSLQRKSQGDNGQITIMMTQIMNKLEQQDKLIQTGYHKTINDLQNNNLNNKLVKIGLKQRKPLDDDLLCEVEGDDNQLKAKFAINSSSHFRQGQLQDNPVKQVPLIPVRESEDHASQVKRNSLEIYQKRFNGSCVVPSPEKDNKLYQTFLIEKAKPVKIPRENIRIRTAPTKPQFPLKLQDNIQQTRSAIPINLSPSACKVLPPIKPHPIQKVIGARPKNAL
ncbi:hypothetical protein FGO68_gene5022 [Halteria grandinella]|uniref:Uncharacterized protein n=1 Tax=Halteria grandinella TaxID=5974 RepID=A0A8J8NEN8_HALGN|nr:hypothetical protein FGO68_gene5022 [Halteria grandinella]